MTLTDWIGTAGVTILLIAFLLNLFKRIPQDGFPYISMNLAGAALACLASVMLNYWPFIILEAAWIAVSLFGLIQLIVKKK
jgi:hypothetical protein